VEKDTKTFLEYVNEAFCQNFELLVTWECVHTCSDFDSGQVIIFGTHTYVNECKIYCIGNLYACMDTHV
jgi:hypothetical protein